MQFTLRCFTRKKHPVAGSPRAPCRNVKLEKSGRTTRLLYSRTVKGTESSTPVPNAVHLLAEVSEHPGWLSQFPDGEWIVTSMWNPGHYASEKAVKEGG